MVPSVWLITGATSGIGASLINEVIRRGDKVIATGRNTVNRLGHLKSDSVYLLDLDITAPLPDIKTQMDEAWLAFGHIDILMNNAGMSAMKPAEEADDEFVNNMFQVNFFGHLRVTQAILPYFRSQGHGCIVFTSSSSLWTPLPYMSHYAASKAALSAYVESLHKELQPLSIRCVAIECGGFPTNLGKPRDPSQAQFGSAGPAIEAYAPLFGALVAKFVTNPSAHMPGDLSKAAVKIADIAKREGRAGEKPWAVRVALGSDGMGSAKQRCEEQLELIGMWKEVSISTDQVEGGGESLANKELFEFTSVL